MDNLVFWGIIIVISGAVLLARVIFNLEFPAIRIIAGLFLILAGIMMLLGDGLPWPFKKAENEIFFRSQTIRSGDEPLPDLQIAFSTVVLHIDRVEQPESREEISINNLFSGSTIYLPCDVPLSITVDAVFAGVKMPGTNTPLFGRGMFTSDNFDPDRPHLAIRANCVFGSVTFMYRH